MPQSTQTYGLDTSVFVRLLTGHPEKEFQETSLALKKLHGKVPAAELVVSNQVIGEAYITLQYHYSISKEDARAAILQLFDTGFISPLNGQSIFEILKSRGGAGLIDADVGAEGAGIHDVVEDHGDAAVGRDA